MFDMEIPCISRPKVVEKGWGREYWIANSSKYCGKRLLLLPEKNCSIHYHKLKDETFFVETGLMFVELWPHGDVDWLEHTPTDENREELRRHLGKVVEITMQRGQGLHIPQGLPHRFTGIEETLFYEFSTQHFDSDSYRIVLGDRLP